MIEIKRLLQVSKTVDDPPRSITEWSCLYSGIESKLMVCSREFSYLQPIVVDLFAGGQERFVLASNYEIGINESRFEICFANLSTLASACFYKNRDFIGGFTVDGDKTTGFAKEPVKAMLEPNDKLFIELTPVNKTLHGLVEIGTGLKEKEGFSFKLPLSNFGAAARLMVYEIMTVGGSITLIDQRGSEFSTLWTEFLFGIPMDNNEVRIALVRKLNEIGLRAVDYIGDICAVL